VGEAMHASGQKRITRLFAAVAAVALLTAAGVHLIPVNPTTAGFGYLFIVLVIASTWGFVEAAAASVAGTLAFNYFFLPPVGTWTISDPENWVALFSFLATSLIASRLSTRARQRANEAIERQQHIERLYTFSRAILLTDAAEPVQKQIVNRLADIFGFSGAVLYDRRTGESYHGGPADFEGLHAQLRDTALQGSTYTDPDGRSVITAVRLGAEPIASLAVQGAPIADSVLQGIANLVAIGLERARAHDMANEAEAARQSEKLRTTLIEAIAHEFKTPLTSIKAATTALLASPDLREESRTELLKIADEEADRLRILMDDAMDMGRLDSEKVRVDLEPLDLSAAINEVVAGMATGIEDRRLDVSCSSLPEVRADKRLLGLAIRQLLDNALKYSPAGMPIAITAVRGASTISISITDYGSGVAPEEQSRIFDRFYRGQTARATHGSGLGLSIAKRIARAHGGDLTVASRPGETTFTLTIPLSAEGAVA
jgi:two-component system sensor histidine kinase KdpD